MNVKEYCEYLGAKYSCDEMAVYDYIDIRHGDEPQRIISDVIFACKQGLMRKRGYIYLEHLSKDQFEYWLDVLDALKYHRIERKRNMAHFRLAGQEIFLEKEKAK